MDTISPARRSENMRRIGSKGMKPELTVRRLVHAMGFRYRLHVRSLPGSPDLVFPKYRKIIFVHGCFWHQHTAARCKITRVPKSNRAYWLTKLRHNCERDSSHQRVLRKRGWSVLIIWECQTNNAAALSRRILKFLDPASA